VVFRRRRRVRLSDGVELLTLLGCAIAAVRVAHILGRKEQNLQVHHIVDDDGEVTDGGGVLGAGVAVCARAPALSATHLGVETLRRDGAGLGSVQERTSTQTRGTPLRGIEPC
jgi:hypothetical protein